MPYIDKEAREYLTPGVLPRNSGEVNYLMTKHILEKFRRGEDLTDFGTRLALLQLWTANPRYQTAADFLSGSVLAIAELRRRNKIPQDYAERQKATITDVFVDFFLTVLGPYEDEKLDENGDVE